MNDPEQVRQFVEAIHAQNLKQEKLFPLIASLSNCLNREMVTEIMQCILETDPVENGDSVHFDDIAVRFDNTGHVTSLYRIIDGSATGVT